MLCKGYVPAGDGERVKKIEEELRALKESGAENAVMTGSGSAVCAFFEDKEELARVAERVGGEFDSLILRTLPARGE